MDVVGLGKRQIEGLALLAVLLALAGSDASAALSLSLNPLDAISQNSTAVLTATVTASGSDASGVSVSLTLPSGLSTSDSTTQSIGTLGAGASTSKSWTLSGDQAGDYTITVSASGTSLQTVTQTASLSVTSPASFTVTVVTNPASTVTGTSSTNLALKFTNSGGSSGDVTVDLGGFSTQLTLSQGSDPWTVSVAADGEQTLTWTFTGKANGTASITAAVTSTANDPTDPGPFSVTVQDISTGGGTSSPSPSPPSPTPTPPTPTPTPTPTTTPTPTPSPTPQVPPDTTTATESQTLPTVTPDAPAVFDFAKPELPVQEVSVSVGSTASNVSVTVDVKAGKPSSVPAAPAAGVVLNYLEFKAENLDQSNVKEARIKFKVSKADISSKNLNKATIALNRYASNAWSKLATTLAGEDSSSVFYEAVTPGFSVFAITGEEEEKKAAACGNSLCESSEGDRK